MGNQINNNGSLTSIGQNTQSTTQVDDNSKKLSQAKAQANQAKAQATGSQTSSQNSTADADDILSRIDKLLLNSSATSVAEPGITDFRIANNNTHDNWGGLGEKWIKNDQGEWHYMIKNDETGKTDVYKWESGTKEGMKNGKDTKVASFNSEFYQTVGEVGPDKIDNFFVANDKTYDNWGGLGEKWIKNDQGEWHYMIKNEESGKTDLYKWDSGTKEGIKNGEDTKVGYLESIYFDKPDYFSGSTELNQKRTSYNINEQGTFDNYLGKNEKWIQNEAGEWHYMIENEETGHIELYAWTSASKEGAQNGEDSLVANIAVKYYSDPSLLETDPPQILFSASQEARDGGELLADDLQTASQEARNGGELLADTIQTASQAAKDGGELLAD